MLVQVNKTSVQTGNQALSLNGIQAKSNNGISLQYAKAIHLSFEGGVVILVIWQSNAFSSLSDRHNLLWPFLEHNKVFWRSIFKQGIYFKLWISMPARDKL